MPEDPEDIEAWQRLDARTTTSGFLKPEDIERLAGIGVCHVINLAPDERPGALEGEADLLAQFGIRYTYIPVPFEAPDDSHFRAFVEAYDDGKEAVHIHCIANYRVSAFFYRYNRDILGMPEEDARAVMHRQWQPDKGEHPVQVVWAQFIRGGGD